MGLQVALLRGINVGGHRKVAMAELRGLFEAMGFTGVKTFINSGNVIFDAGGRHGSELETFIEAEAERRLGLKTAFILRDEKELAAAIEANPFPEQARTDPSHLMVSFLKTASPRGAFEALQAEYDGPELLSGHGRELFIYYPTGMGRSLLTDRLMMSKLQTTWTARNWNTVLKLRQMLSAAD